MLVVASAIYTWFSPVNDANIYFFITVGLAILYGVFFVLPIGGADMPVVISLLNSFTGVAAACGGFLYDNKAMLTGGILVGAAGTLLCQEIFRNPSRQQSRAQFADSERALPCDTQCGHESNRNDCQCDQNLNQRESTASTAAARI